MKLFSILLPLFLLISSPSALGNDMKPEMRSYLENIVSETDYRRISKLLRTSSKRNSAILVDVLSMFVADHAWRVDKDGTEFAEEIEGKTLLACDNTGGTFFVGFAGGNCVAFIYDGHKHVDLMPLKLREINAGITIKMEQEIDSFGELETHQIMGVDHLEDVPGYYMALKSTATAFGSTWVFKKIGSKGYGYLDGTIDNDGFKWSLLNWTGTYLYSPSKGVPTTICFTLK